MQHSPIRADLTDQGLALDARQLSRALDALPEDAPVVAMVHGWRYAPGLGPDCPHETILAPDPLHTQSPRVTSWPRPLGLDGQRGLGIALGWPARCGLRTAHGRAEQAGRALAEVAALVQRLAPRRRLHVIGHSMGARVALSALAQAPAGSMGRLILLTGAEARGPAAAALHSPAGRSANVINVATRENDLFDALWEWGVHLGLRTSIGQGLGRVQAGWHDLWLDDPATLSALSRRGFDVAPVPGRVCHWSPYLRAGALPLYRALLDGRLPVDALPRPQPRRRWSRLMSPPRLGPPPFGLPAG